MPEYRHILKKEIGKKAKNHDPDEMVIMIPRKLTEELKSKGITINEYLNKYNIACPTCSSMKIIKLEENKLRCGNCGNEYPMRK